VEAFTSARSESYIETKAVRHYTQDQQPPAPEKSIKTQGENPRKHRATTERNQQEEIHTHLKTTGKKTTAQDQPRAH